jgi:hypothetical protein
MVAVLAVGLVVDELATAVVALAVVVVVVLLLELSSGLRGTQRFDDHPDADRPGPPGSGPGPGGGDGGGIGGGL